MIRNWIGVLFLICIGFFFLILGLHYQSESYRHYSILNAMEASGQESATESMDRSSRSGRALYLDQKAYQKRFKVLFEKNVKVKVEPKDYQFSFRTEDDAVKLIHVVMTDERGTPYPVTLATDVTTQ